MRATLVRRSSLFKLGCGTMIGTMRWLTTLLLLASAPAAAQTPFAGTVQPHAMSQPVQAWNPVAPYVTAGQDEPGYRVWYAGAPWRQAYVRNFHHYLTQHGVAGVVPTWQLLRTATSWRKCGSEPFEVPPVQEWPHLVQTLRYVHAYVIPAIGPVEPVSGYRNPHLNVCAGGAPGSAHKSYSAIDLVPLRPTTREQLMRTLCAVHAQRGTDYQVGLGFYAFLRFHVDTTKYRRWGTDVSSPDCPPIIRPTDIATVAQPQQMQSTAPETPSGGPASAPGLPKIVIAPTATVAAVPDGPSPTAPSQQLPQPQK